MGPLLLDHDVVVADMWVDTGASTAALLDSAEDKGRRLLLVPGWVPRELLAEVVGDRPLRALVGAPHPVLEVGPHDVARGGPGPG